MKTLDLNAYGVEEMNLKEMVTTVGGENIFQKIANAIADAIDAVGEALAAALAWAKDHSNSNGSAGITVRFQV
jgi:hypothetical protein